MDFRLGGGELGQDAAQTEGLLAQRRSDPVLARCRGIALVEDEIDHLEDGAEARNARGAARDLEPDMRLGEGPFRADDPLRDRRDRNEEGPRDFLGRQPAKDAQGEGDPCFLRKDRMAGHKYQAQQIVPELIVGRRVEVRSSLQALDIASDLFMLALERLATPDHVDSAVFGGSHEPRARPVRHTRGRPLLECGDQGVLCKLLGSPDVADDASQPGDQPGRLDPPDRFDRAIRFGSCFLAATWVGGRAPVSWTYRQSSFTCPRTRRPHGSRTCRRRRVPASATRGPRRSTAPAKASIRPQAPWSPRTVRR